MRKSRVLLTGGLAVLLLAVASQGQSPLPSRAETPEDPTREYRISPLAGPWMICAASYSGPDAPDLACQLVQQIRTRYQLSAYIFNRADEERRKQKEELDRVQQQQQSSIIPMRKRTIRVEEQCAVLVGGYPDMDSARKALDGIKKLPIPELKLGSGRPAFDTIFVAAEDGKKQKQEPVNPFQTAFVTRNPTVSQGQSASKVDPLWWKLNEGNEYNLLECKKSWTLVVKQYTGAKSLVSQETTSGGFLSKILPGGGSPGKLTELDKAALQAQELAKVLRQLNFQAYVLHTRTSSLVTIGGFTGVEDPEMGRVRQQLAALQNRFNSSRHDPFLLYQDPVPWEVPKKP